jgi:hypothetical protein
MQCCTTQCSATPAEPMLSATAADRTKQPQAGHSLAGVSVTARHTPQTQTQCTQQYPLGDSKIHAGHSLAGVSVAGLHVVAFAVAAHVSRAQHLLAGATTAARLGHQLTTHLEGFASCRFWWRQRVGGGCVRVSERKQRRERREKCVQDRKRAQPFRSLVVWAH